MEFYADASSLLIALYEILIIIFNYINNFWAEQSLSKKVFFFKELENNNFNINQKFDKIQELLDITEMSLNEQKRNEKIINENSKTSSKKKSDNFGDAENEEVKIYNNKKSKNNYGDYYDNDKAKEKYEENKTSNKRSKDNNDYNNYDKYSSGHFGSESESKFNYRYNMNMKNRNRIRKNNIYKSSDLNESDYNTNKSFEEESFKKQEYEFNIFEVIAASLCKCCLTKNLKIKSELNGKANSYLYNKMEISLYIRNMMLFDIFNDIFVEPENKDIINFLCRPIITRKNSGKNDLSLYYKGYRDKDFSKFYNQITHIIEKSDKKSEDLKLISLSNQHLKYLVN